MRTRFYPRSTKSSQPLPEKFEKILKLEDEKDGDDDDSEMSEDELTEEEYAASHPEYRREKAKQIAKVFVQQVQDNQFAEFKWPPDPDCPLQFHECLRDHLCTWNSLAKKSEAAKEYLDQVRKSWGYDVNCMPPPGMAIIFIPRDLQSELGEWEESKIKQATECVIERINAEAQKMGKTFEFVRLDKVVQAYRYLFFLTLTLKDVGVDAEITIRATVYNPPPCINPELEECKLISSVPANC